MSKERACEAVGIDLGTTYSAMAFMDSNMIPRMVINAKGQSIIPSVVYFDEEEVLVGEAALENAEIEAEHVAQFIKVHMGEAWRKTYRGHEHTPESISAIILGNLVKQASHQIGPVKKAVITVPAYFNEKRRRATQQAGEIAGLEVIGTLNEPMSATLAYGLHRLNKEQIVAVYDLGGGTFDVTIVKITPDEITELATKGNRELGGKDWDHALVEFVAQDFEKEHGVNPMTDPQGLQDLILACEKAKRRLTDRSNAKVKLHAHGKAHITQVTREQFEELTADLLEMTRMTMEMALKKADLGWNDVDRVVLVGGSTFMPMVHTMIEDATGRAPDTNVNPVMAVALGAAIYACMLETGKAPRTIRLDESAPDREPPETEYPVPPQGSEADVPPVQVPPAQPEAPPSREITAPKVRFVTAHGVGVRVRDPNGTGWKNSVLIPEQTPVPNENPATKTFISADKIRAGSVIKIEITQGDSEDIDLVEILGEGRIEGFDDDQPAGQPVEVSMWFDEQSRLHTKAVYVRTKQEMLMAIDVAGGLCQEEVERHHEKLKEMGAISLEESR